MQLSEREDSDTSACTYVTLDETRCSVPENDISSNHVTAGPSSTSTPHPKKRPDAFNHFQDENDLPDLVPVCPRFRRVGPETKIEILNVEKEGRSSEKSTEQTVVRRNDIGGLDRILDSLIENIDSAHNFRNAGREFAIFFFFFRL